MPNYKKRFHPHQVRGNSPFCGHRNYPILHTEPANRISENDNQEPQQSCQCEAIRWEDGSLLAGEFKRPASEVLIELQLFVVADDSLEPTSFKRIKQLAIRSALK
jgi:hypothetical protein